MEQYTVHPGFFQMQQYISSYERERIKTRTDTVQTFIDIFYIYIKLHTDVAKNSSGFSGVSVIVQELRTQLGERIEN